MCLQALGYGKGFYTECLETDASVTENVENVGVTNSITPITENINKTFKSRNNCKNTYTRNILNQWEIVKPKRNRYRGRGRINRRDNSFSILLINLRGYKSKETSLKKIIKTIQPSALLLNETLLSGRMKVSLIPYTTWCKNRTEKGGGGVSTSVGEQYKDSAIGAGEHIYSAGPKVSKKYSKKDSKK